MPYITIVVVVAMAAGAFARRHSHHSDRFVTVSLDLVMLFLIPIIGFAYASRLVLNLSTIVGILGGYAVIATLGLIAWQVTDRRMHLNRAQQGGVVLAVVLANTGYLGLPVAITLLGRDELPQSVAWDSLISQPMALLIAPFIAGAFSPTHQHAHLGKQLVSVLKRAPAIPALIAGLLVPDGWVPQWLLDLATWFVYAILPLGFFAVGVTLMRLRHADGEENPPRAAIGLVLLLRNIVAPVLFIILGLLVLPDEPRAFTLQAAMPCGLNALVIGHAFDLDTGVIATAIAWSTAIVLAVALVGGVLL
jgi:predicted permease